MPSPLETWFLEIPPITRIYVSAACCTSLAVHLGFIHPIQLWLNYQSIVYDYQWWRLITNFFYFGTLSIDFCFHVFFLARYSRMMEEGFFRNKPADYVWLMLFSASVLIILSIIVPFAHLPFMGSALSFTMVYIWARRNPYVRLNFLGLIVFTAPYLPWVLLIFSLCLSGQVPVGDMLGILVGHIYYFFEDVWPRDPISNGKKWLATPRLIRWLIEGNRARDDSIEINTAESEREIVIEEEEETTANNGLEESEPLLANDTLEVEEEENNEQRSNSEKPYRVDTSTEKEGESFENVKVDAPVDPSSESKEQLSSISSSTTSNTNTTAAYNSPSNNISVDKTVSDNNREDTS